MSLLTDVTLTSVYWCHINKCLLVSH